jgi:hypothetical protein
VLGYQKLSVFHNDLNSFYEVYEKFINESKNNYGTFYSTLQSNQVGINIEFEIIFKTLTSVNDWFSNRFFPTDANSFFSETIMREVKFQVNEETNGKNFGVTIQPRAGVTNGLYCLINDHYGISPSEHIFDLSQMKKYINKTLDKTKEKIIPYIVK